MIEGNIVAHEKETIALNQILATLRSGLSNIVLISGEAGVGVTTCVEMCLRYSSFLVLRGHASETNIQPFGPIIETLRAVIRNNRDALVDCEVFREYLAILLPELGDAPANSDQATLFEALQCVFLSAAEKEATVLFLDDLQWSDSSTLEWLVYFARGLQKVPLLIIAAYRSDEITRNHPIRHFRHELRRANRLTEIEIPPLALPETQRLAYQILNHEPDSALVHRLYELTQGIPLLINELLQALDENQQLLELNGKIGLRDETNVSLPENVKDVILLRLSRFGEDARNLLEVMAVAGVEFEINNILSVTNSDAGLSELIDRQIIVETRPRYAKFRHALTREVVYQNIIWTRRQNLHLKLAETLEDANALPRQIADHWLAGHDLIRGRQALIRSADEFCRIHAYRDAVEAAQEALNFWEKGEDDKQRIHILQRLAHCAQLTGMYSEAIQALKEIAEFQKETGHDLNYANTQRQMANVFEMQQMWESMIAARKSAADIYLKHQREAEAAAQHLMIANYLHLSDQFTVALELVREAVTEAELGDKVEIYAEALGLEGQLRAKLGDFEAGLRKAQEGLSLALDRQLSSTAASVYIKLASVYEHASKRKYALSVYQEAVSYCTTHHEAGQENLCIGCMICVFTETGEWDQVIQLTERFFKTNVDPVMRASVLTFNVAVYVQRGDLKTAKKYIQEARTTLYLSPKTFPLIRLEWNQACLDLLEGHPDSALRRCQFILNEWQKTEEWLYTIAPVRFCATTFAALGARDEVQQCMAALVSLTGVLDNAEVKLSFSFILGEIALLDLRTAEAVEHFRQALLLIEPLGMPLYEAEIRFRLAHAFVADKRGDEAADMLVTAYRITQSLGAETLGKQILAMLDELNVPIDQRLGQRVANLHQRAGLTKRQLEVLKLIADGLTNAQIAGQLVLSPRTVEMHVGNILNRLNCNSRAEAVRIAMEQALLS